MSPASTAQAGNLIPKYHKSAGSQHGAKLIAVLSRACIDAKLLQFVNGIEVLVLLSFSLLLLVSAVQQNSN